MLAGKAAKAYGDVSDSFLGPCYSVVQVAVFGGLDGLFDPITQEYVVSQKPPDVLRFLFVLFSYQPLPRDQDEF